MAALALGAPALAHAETFPRAAVGAEVHADDGAVIGHVTAVTRDRGGQVTSMEIPGLEPPDASSLNGPRVGENDAGARPVRVIDMRARQRERVDETGARQHARLR
jgi:hypothetical protein